jgi:hypothetical protein
MRFHASGAVLMLMLAGGLALAADTPKEQAKEPAPAKAPAKGTEKDKDKAKDKSKDKEKEKDKPPACMHCGATCGLEAVCVCECGTKKKPKTEYEAKCDPICVPKCSGLPWPFSRCHRGGCTGSCTECRTESCRAWVRQRKTLSKETKDEEVSVIERKVKYVCCRCAGAGRAGCCGESAAGCGWWQGWLHWLPVPGRAAAK